MSTSGQEASIPQQRDWAHSAVPKAGFELAGEFADEGIPGSEVERREQLQALLEFFEKRHEQKRPVRRLFVWDTDRFSRASSIRTAALLDRLMEAGLTHIHTADEVYDLDEDLDVVLLNLKQDLMKAGYAKSISKNILRDRQARAALGLWPGGPIPTGYQRGDDGHLVVDPLWAPIIRWIFDRYAYSSASLADICRELNADPAVPRPPSGCWNNSFVHRILIRRAYLGHVHYGEYAGGKYYQNQGGQVVRVKGSRGRRRMRKAPPGNAVVCENAHEPLVTQETFDAVAKKLFAQRWKRTTPIAGGGVWVLSGLACCGSCGHSMVGRTDHHKRAGAGGKTLEYVYRKLFCTGKRDCGLPCTSGSVSQDVILTELTALIKAEFGKPSHVERIGRQIEKLLADKEGQDVERRDALTAKLLTLDNDLTTATRRLLVLPDDVLPHARREFENMQKEREALSKELERLDEARQVSQTEAQRMREALADLGRLESIITEKPPELVRDLLQRVVKQVTLHFDAAAASPGKLARIDVAFRPEVAHLFTAGSLHC
jgi:DNA invertase Pin-like site-specific DNA recombinase